MKDETPLGWFRFAHSYFHGAAVLYTDEARPQWGHYEAPVRFLYMQAIELFVKTYLRISNMSEQEIMKRPYQHDLVQLLEKAEEFGMPMTKRIQRVRDNQHLGERQIETRYLRTGLTRVLAPVRLHEAARDLQGIVQGRLLSEGVAIGPLAQVPHVHQSRPLSAGKAARLLRRM